MTSNSIFLAYTYLIKAGNEKNYLFYSPIAETHICSAELTTNMYLILFVNMQ